MASILLAIILVGCLMLPGFELAQEAMLWSAAIAGVLATKFRKPYDSKIRKIKNKLDGWYDEYLQNGF